MTINIQEIAAQQLRDYDAHNPGTVFESEMAFTVTDAYAIQAEVCRLREARGEHSNGYKTGCTTPEIQKMMGISNPVMGRLYSSEFREPGVSLPANLFCQLAIEGELAVRLATDLPDGTNDAVLLDAIESVFAVIELHNYCFRRQPHSVEELIANNAIHAGVVCSSASTTQLPDDSETLRVHINGKEVDAAAGRDLRETVISSLRWLARKCNAEGQPLQQGQIVLCGTVAGLFPVGAGSIVEITTDTCGTVSCKIN